MSCADDIHDIIEWLLEGGLPVAAAACYYHLPVSFVEEFLRDAEHSNRADFELEWIRRLTLLRIAQGRMRPYTRQDPEAARIAKVIAEQAHTKRRFFCPAPAKGPVVPGIVPHTLDPEEVVWSREASLLAVAHLTAREQAILRMRFYAELTLAEIGECLGCSRERARQLLEKALYKIRRRLLSGRS